ncbi:MAG: SAM-dependent methyltransferase, partial [Gammaproteobacteria bacterium]|nr:SAM-dependent methyltransferase [Gammaproteobacteria bacterium]
MKDIETTYDFERVPSGTSSPRLVEKLSRRLVLRRLSGIETGQLAVRDEYGTKLLGGTTDTSGLKVSINVIDQRFYSEIALGGAVGAAEAYMQGYWNCDDLTLLVRLLVRNRNVLDNMDSGAARLSVPLRKLLHRINRNTKRGSRKN